MMSKIKYFIYLLLFISNVQGQGGSVKVNNSDVYMLAEEMPSYPEGVKAMLNFVKQNTKYPISAAKNKIEGRVYVSFVIDSEGKITKPKVLRGLGFGCDEEALRVVNLMPNWNPGKQDGKNVSVEYNLIVNFYK